MSRNKNKILYVKTYFMLKVIALQIKQDQILGQCSMTH